MGLAASPLQPTMVCVQRLFSIFPSGRPGIALLMLRIGLSVIVFEAAGGLLARPDSLWAVAVVGSAALMFWMGLLTPVVCALCVVLDAVSLVLGGDAVGPVHLCLFLNAVALALLGPGGYSLDARLYGRQRIAIPTE